MNSLTVENLEGRSSTIDGSKLEGLASQVSGRLLSAGTAGYDEARSIWNAMIDKKPALIVECQSTQDVVAAVKFAQANGLYASVRGGGHNIAGKALCDGGMLIDLSPMKTVTVDAGKRTAVSGPGATLADVDAATQAHGLALPVGINSTTGIAGLTLGGGFGWISRSHGLTIDNLVSAQVVTAQGEVVTASETENPDLFWAIRGGGGNFGVVTSFVFRLHPVGPEVLSGLIVYPFAQAADVIKQYRELAKKADDKTTVWMVARKAPPLPFLPEDVHGTDILVLAAMYCGDMAEGEKALAPYRAIGKQIA
ncbi:MAG TPA: FAD-binding oxidoreductase, partial [Fimbriimonadaceae bacterium]|nr:FAD-binding oxidoreductase [Fimbriimonadaceae bacterium]